MGEAAVPYILGVAAAASAAGTGYQIAAAEEAKDRADKQAQLIEEQTTKALNEESAAREEDKRLRDAAQKAAEDEASRDSARARQRDKAKGTFGRRDTILTSPLGLPSSSTGSTSGTLLGG